MASAGRIDIDVVFKPLESSIGQLRTALDSVADDSQFGRKLAKQISSIEPRLTKLKAEFSSGVLDSKGIKSFNSEFNKLVRQIEIASNGLSQLSNIDISKLSLPADLNASYKASLGRQQKAEEKYQDSLKNSGAGAMKYLRENKYIEKNGTRFTDENGKVLAEGRGVSGTTNFKVLMGELQNGMVGAGNAFNRAQASITKGSEKIDNAYEEAKERFLDIFGKNVTVDKKTGKATFNGSTATQKKTAYKNILEETGAYQKSSGTKVGELLSENKLDSPKTGTFNEDFAQVIYDKIVKGLLEKATKEISEEDKGKVIESLGSNRTIDAYKRASAQIKAGQKDQSNAEQSQARIKEAYDKLYDNQGNFNASAINEYNLALSACEEEQEKYREEAIQRIAVEERQAAISQNVAQATMQMSSAMAQYNAEQKAGDNFEKTVGNMQKYVASILSFSSGIKIVKNTISSVASAVKELDDVITSIAIVTNMNQDDLWGQLDQYTQLAQKYGVTIKGAYEVSQIFYQQGLTTSNVMSMTNETLKMAKIAGLDYSTAADYMTVAVKAFDIEMSNASQVTDVYSALAASCATDVNELATAMSKTASSAASVNATFENTSAILATMIANTRESPENLGSALKSIISRYGSLTTDITATEDENGESINYNDVDEALKSVGITLKDSSGQFRNFDDVLLELASTWDTLDTLSQRYIATQLAGNR